MLQAAGLEAFPVLASRQVGAPTHFLARKEPVARLRWATCHTRSFEFHRNTSSERVKTTSKENQTMPCILLRRQSIFMCLCYACQAGRDGTGRFLMVGSDVHTPKKQKKQRFFGPFGATTTVDRRGHVDHLHHRPTLKTPSCRCCCWSCSRQRRSCRSCLALRENISKRSCTFSSVSPPPCNDESLVLPLLLGAA